MQFAKNIYDIKSRTILDMRVGGFSDTMIIVTTDGMLHVVEFALTSDDPYSNDEVRAVFYQEHRAKRFLMKNPGIREWLFSLGVMSENEMLHYQELIEAEKQELRKKREQATLKEEQQKLINLMNKHPDVVRRVLEEATDEG